MTISEIFKRHGKFITYWVDLSGTEKVFVVFSCDTQEVLHSSMNSGSLKEERVVAFIRKVRGVHLLSDI